MKGSIEGGAGLRDLSGSGDSRVRVGRTLPQGETASTPRTPSDLDSQLIRPAMRVGEWEDRETWMPVVDFPRGGNVQVSDFPDKMEQGKHITVPDGYRHALAAACLIEQPYGFTWADVDVLRSARVFARAFATPNAASVLETLPERIAALLPPRCNCHETPNSVCGDCTQWHALPASRS